MLDGMEKIVDENAFTLTEIQSRTGKSKEWVRAMIKQKVADGEWEQVWKGTPQNPARAYRPKRA
jgi:hypothetical protein